MSDRKSKWKLTCHGMHVVSLAKLGYDSRQADKLNKLVWPVWHGRPWRWHTYFLQSESSAMELFQSEEDFLWSFKTNKWINILFFWFGTLQDRPGILQFCLLSWLNKSVLDKMHLSISTLCMKRTYHVFRLQYRRENSRWRDNMFLDLLTFSKIRMKYKVNTFSFSLCYVGELWTYLHSYHKNGNNVSHDQ